MEAIREQQFGNFMENACYTIYYFRFILLDPISLGIHIY